MTDKLDELCDKLDQMADGEYKFMCHYMAGIIHGYLGDSVVQTLIKVAEERKK